MNNINRIIAARLRELRKKIKLTQAEFGRKFRVSATTVVTWESGNKEFTVEELFEFSNFFNVHPMYFMQGICETETELDKYWFELRTSPEFDQSKTPEVKELIGLIMKDRNYRKAMVEHFIQFKSYCNNLSTDVDPNPSVFQVAAICNRLIKEKGLTLNDFYKALAYINLEDEIDEIKESSFDDGYQEGYSKGRSDNEAEFEEYCYDPS